MAGGGKFKLVELQRTAQGTFVETPVRFEWDAKTRSSPRQGWEYGVHLRTARDDYPGSDEPVEQVLGTNYETFDLAGVWDDRWAGKGFAENQRVEFEKLVQRGNLCRLTFEGITFTGLLTNLKATYLTSFRTAYHFTVSPHYRLEAGDARRAGQIRVPAVSDPLQGLIEVDKIIDETLAKLQSAPRPRITGDTFSTIASSVGDWQARADQINQVVAGRVLSPQGDALNSLSRVVQSFQGLRNSAAALLPLTASLSTAVDLDFEDAITDLSFESWARGISNDARRIIVSAERTWRALSALVDPKARAVYRPHAGESLYSISNRFFQMPHMWRAIAERNNLVGFTLTGTELLVIPDQRTS